MYEDAFGIDWLNIAFEKMTIDDFFNTMGDVQTRMSNAQKVRWEYECRRAGVSKADDLPRETYDRLIESQRADRKIGDAIERALDRIREGMPREKERKWYQMEHKDEQVKYGVNLYDLLRYNDDFSIAKEFVEEEKWEEKLNLAWERIRAEVELMQDAGELPGGGTLIAPRIDLLKVRIVKMRSTQEIFSRLTEVEGWIAKDKRKICEYVAGMELLKSYLLTADWRIPSGMKWAELITEFLSEEYTYKELMPWRYGLPGTLVEG